MSWEDLGPARTQGAVGTVCSESWGLCVGVGRSCLSPQARRLLVFCRHMEELVVETLGALVSSEGCRAVAHGK